MVEVEAAGPPRCVNDHISLRQEQRQPFVVLTGREARLAGVPSSEPQRVPSQRVSSRWLHLYDRRAQVGEDAPGHGGRLAGRIHDANSLQQLLRHVPTLTPRVASGTGGGRAARPGGRAARAGGRAARAGGRAARAGGRAGRGDKSLQLLQAVR